MENSSQDIKKQARTKQTGYAGAGADMRSMNRSMLMHLIYKYPGITRANLAKMTGLTGASVSKITNDLIETNVIHETGYVPGTMGRRAIGLEVNTDSFMVLALKLSRRELLAGVFDLSNNQIEQHCRPLTKDTSAKDIVSLMAETIYTYIEKYPDIKAIGIAAPGPFDVKEKVVQRITELNDYEKTDLSPLGNLPLDVPVFFIHDANAGAMAEWMLNESNFIADKTIAYYLVGEGVGAGIIDNGQIILGKKGMAAEIGHVSLDFAGPRCSCGNYGCLELYTSSLRFVERAKERLVIYPDSSLNTLTEITAGAIFRAAEQGDELAISLTKEVGRYIGFGAVNIVNTFDPDEIIIGDEMAQGSEILLNEVKEVVAQRSISQYTEPVVIRYEDKENDRILLGAASVAIDNCLKNIDLLRN